MIPAATSARTAAPAWRKAATALVALVAGLALALGAAAIFADDAQALSAKNKAAHKAYQSKLYRTSVANNGNISYYYKDIDGDKVDEMVMWAGNEAAGTQFYTYKSGKLKKLATISHGQYSRYWPKTKTLYAQWGHMGVFRDTYYKWNTKKSKATVAAQRTTDTNPAATGGSEVYTYEVNGKTTTKARYNAYVKKLKSGSAKNLAKAKFKAYNPVTSKAKALTFFKKWAKKKDLPRVDRIECEGFVSGKGYSIRGVYSYSSHDATAYRYYVRKSGEVSLFW